MKKYYRLSELQGAFGISLADIHYLNAETDISFCLFCKTTEVILGGYDKGKFCGFGRANYSGLISLTKSQQTKIFEHNKISITQSTLLQKDKVTNYNIEYPFSVEMPNKVLKKWLTTSFEKIPFEIIPFSFYPEERKSMMKEFCKLLDDITIEGNKETNPSPFAALYDPTKPIKKELFDKWQSFTFDDLCIIANEVEKAQKYLSGNTINKDALKQDNEKIITPNKRSDDFNDLLKVVVEKHPKFTAKEYWRVLESESEEMEGFRLLDKHNILVEIEGNKVEWQDIKGKPRKAISFSSFTNRLTTVKKMIYDNTI